MTDVTSIMKHAGKKQEGGSASELISKRIADLGDWRGQMLGARPRADQRGRP